MSNTNVKFGGSDWLFGWAFLIMFTAKVFGFIDWSWWIITIPLWGPVVAILVILILVLIGVGVWMLSVMFADWVRK